MKTKLTIREYIFLSSMLFGMFFGAGNLIFPVFLGNQAGGNMVSAIIGFCITGVGMPLLGIVAMALSKSNGLYDMSSKAGKAFGMFFSVALYLSIGPLFAIPRAATVSFTVGLSPFVAKEHQTLALSVFSLVFFSIVLFFSLKPSGILTWIGKLLNPTFLIFLGILIVAVFIKPMGDISQIEPLANYGNMSFVQGILDGYNTMDVLASLAFGIILIDVVKNLGITDSKKISASAMKAGFFAVLGMAFIYISLALAGAGARNVVGEVADGGEALNKIANHYFGTYGAFLLGLIITFACLKTAIGLVTACSTTFTEMFPNKFSYNALAIVFSIFSFGLSNFGLGNIIKFSIPVLISLYPMAIVLIALCLIDGFFKLSKPTYVITMTLTVLAALTDFFKALPQDIFANIPAVGTSLQNGVNQLVELSNKLPLSVYSMAWIPFAAAGFVIGVMASLITKKK